MTPRQHYEAAARSCGAVPYETPFRILTPEERRDRTIPGAHTFQVRYDEKTGVYRDCPACDGYGTFPGEPLLKGCPSCEHFCDADFSSLPPPVTFHADRPDDIESAKKFLSIKALTDATASPAAFESHWHEMKVDQDQRTDAHARSVPHYLFRCRTCQATRAIPSTDLGTKWGWQYDTQAPYCTPACNGTMRYAGHQIPTTEGIPV